MQFATTKFFEKSILSPLHRRQTLGLIKRQHFASTANIASQRGLNETTPSTEKANFPKPTNITNEPAYIPHFKQTRCTTSENGEPIWEHPIDRAVYDLKKISSIEITHHPIKKMHERVAYLAVKALRTSFDILSGYRGPGGAMTEKDWLNRCLFLESVAGVPGMVGGMLRHLRSLRKFKRDYGWIHTLLEEAENERMHLLIFMNIKQPGYIFRTLVLGAQGVFFNGFFLTYLMSPKTCHRFVGYLEEEAVKTYTCLLKEIEDGHLEEWKTKKAPLIAQTYYKLPETASLYDMVKCVRADECSHRDVNHAFADLDQKKGISPFVQNQ
ncbi:alternative mitochondrial precursor [Plasmopara halstedii]|uniref:Alternative mitochondrial n=1 Tax=Plasmopara halstedii TaxID=4781 RepID=A0A0P1AJG9_PLAHL|nr:alternative mitochondrial precursor [Plasmopara halstedii]CEG40703.1 alternative mitochondrial precursor [Plasmopara halstedii]|eukprot:XP_024577072.1 alternative mitochondrial precursor [Plasmopara halstedii]